jgi:hypothetical protein
MKKTLLSAVCLILNAQTTSKPKFHNVPSETNTITLPENWHKELPAKRIQNHFSTQKRVDILINKNIFSKKNNTNKIKTATKILANVKALINIHPKEGARIRVYLLDFLESSSTKKDLPAIEDACKKMLKDLKNKKRFPGQEADLIDMLKIWILTYGSKDLLQNPEILFETFSYTNKYRNLFATALGYVYKNDRKVFLDFISKDYR